MKQTFNEATVQTEGQEQIQIPAVDHNLALFTERQQLANEIKGLEARKKLLDEDIKAAMIESGEQFGNEREYLAIQPEERTTFDFKAAILAGLMTAQQAEPFLKRTVFGKLVVKKVEVPSVSPEPGSEEDAKLRKNIANASARLIG